MVDGHQGWPCRSGPAALDRLEDAHALSVAAWTVDESIKFSSIVELALIATSNQALRVVIVHLSPDTCNRRVNGTPGSGPMGPR